MGLLRTCRSSQRAICRCSRWDKMGQTGRFGVLYGLCSGRSRFMLCPRLEIAVMTGLRSPIPCLGPWYGAQGMTCRGLCREVVDTSAVHGVCLLCEQLPWGTSPGRWVDGARQRVVEEGLRVPQLDLLTRATDKRLHEAGQDGRPGERENRRTLTSDIVDKVVGRSRLRASADDPSRRTCCARGVPLQPTWPTRWRKNKPTRAGSRGSLWRAARTLAPQAIPPGILGQPYS